MRIPAFISIDFSLSCETVNAFTDQNIKAKKLNIEKMIMYAPECIDSKYGGLMPNDDDHCGIKSGITSKKKFKYHQGFEDEL